MTNRIETYKSLKRQYLSKTKGKQKERVTYLLNLYKDGKIFSKITAQQVLNRYLGRFKDDNQR